MSKETVNDLDKPFNFQLRNLNPREARGLPRSRGQSGGWHVDRLHLQPPHPLPGLNTPSLPSLQQVLGNTRYIQICVFTFMLVLCLYNQRRKTCIRFSKFKFCLSFHPLLKFFPSLFMVTLYPWGRTKMPFPIVCWG